MARSLIWWKPTTIRFSNVSYYFIKSWFDWIYRILSYNESPDEPMFASLWSFPINIERSISVWMPGTMFMCPGLHWQEGLILNKASQTKFSKFKNLNPKSYFAGRMCEPVEKNNPACCPAPCPLNCPKEVTCSYSGLSQEYKCSCLGVTFIDPTKPDEE